MALPVPLDRVFDYTTDDPGVLAADLESPLVGRRVRVGFGGQQLVGLVVPGELRSEDEPSGGRSLAAIDELLDEEPVVSEALIRVLAEEARAIFCPIGQAIAHALPPGATPRLSRPYALTRLGERALAQGALGAGALGGDARPILERLAERPATRTTLARALPKIAVGPRLEALVRDGLVERRHERKVPRARVPSVRIARVAEGLDLERTIATTLARASAQATCLRRLAEHPAGIAAQALTADDATAAAALRALVRRGLASIESRSIFEATDCVLDGGGRVALTDDQRDALASICDAIKRELPTRFLLHGVTGSGKTEVYLQAVAETLAAGRQALVLVPEITLTHQIVARLRARFGDEVAVLHSGLKPGERLAQWERLRTRQTAIAVGARSALFAPLEALGLVVIDEEHDGAYKNEEGFRYHARELAERRAAHARCPLVLGSATPSLESRFRAEQGELRRLSLPRRVGGRPLPAVEIVDLAKEKAKATRGRKAILSRPLRRAIATALAAGGQTILFLNRRGFSTRIFCFQCGHAERCNDCDVALVFHAGEHALRCHYCDHTRPVPECCSGCGDPETALLGVGTERLEEEVRALFPDARTLRLDRDTAARRGHTEKVLRALRDEAVDIVIGTQMVAKGHDFPGVQLVGVVAADLGLHLPDFRAAERTFQLLTQVAGRAGRATRPGHVVVQTFVPDHYALVPVATHDYESFYRTELEHRQALGYPPFGLLARVIVHAEDEGEALAAAESLASAAREAVAAHARASEVVADRPLSPIEILGPAPAPISRLRGRFRFMLLFKGRDPVTQGAACEAVLAAARKVPRTVAVGLDARPVSML
ncbi:MAG: primosomal protein N' [Deltaproteobacteria bacterium]|nr:primosomal protein N' [Deltaproteobacteria bacterium]